MPALKQAGKAGSQSHKKTHHQDSTIQSGGNPQLLEYPQGVKRLGHTPSTPTFKTSIQGTNLQGIYFWKGKGGSFHETHTA